MQILPFDFDIIHVPGKINIIPDVGSRAVARKDGKTEDTRRQKSLEKIIEDQINEMEKANGVLVNHYPLCQYMNLNLP